MKSSDFYCKMLRESTSFELFCVKIDTAICTAQSVMTRSGGIHIPYMVCLRTVKI